MARTIRTEADWGSPAYQAYQILRIAFTVAPIVMVALKPGIGGYVVCAWLIGIIINFLLIPNYFVIASRDVGLALGSLALARLSKEFA